MVSFPNAKINLGLNIVSKREDGYHNIESCFYPVGWTDVLEILPAKTFVFKSTGLTIPGSVESNLCCLAYQLLKKDFDLPEVQIHLHKVIPMGAGLGGGSSDGSFTLRMLNEMFSLDLSVEQLQKYASKLGSDCPFFIENKPVIVTGIGNEFDPVDNFLQGFKVILIYPEVHVSTQEAYAKMAPKLPDVGVKVLMEKARIMDWGKRLVNDFETSVISQAPVIGTLKEFLYSNGAIYASMTGSGSSLYGIFDANYDIDKLVLPDQSLLQWKGTLGHL